MPENEYVQRIRRILDVNVRSLTKEQAEDLCSRIKAKVGAHDPDEAPAQPAGSGGDPGASN